MSPLATILYALLLTVHVASPPPGMSETPAELDARLRSIAVDAATAAHEDAADALLILAVSQHESAFAVDVDRGPCRAGSCPGGAVCLMQIEAPKQLRAELQASRPLCFAYGLDALHKSQAACRSHDPAVQFAAYASGSCSSAAGKRASAELYGGWRAWLGAYWRESAK